MTTPASLERRALKIVGPEDCPAEWNRYVASHPQGAIFHTAEMFRVYRETPKHAPCAAAAVDESGAIVALLPAVRIDTLGGFARWLASRAVLYAAPLCDATEQGREGLRALLRRHDRSLRSRALFTEIRPLVESGEERQPLEAAGYRYRDYLNYVVDLETDQETLWQRVGKSTRKHIRSSLRRGVAVEIDNTHRGVDRMHCLVSESYKRSQVPLAGREMFHSALDILGPEIVQIRIATHQGRDVAGGIGLLYRRRFYAWYGGSLREKSIAPFDCLTWDEVEWASRNGAAIYDFGGAGWPDVPYGPREFKAKFGGQLVRFGRYQRVYSRVRMALAAASYQLLRPIVSK